MILSNSTRPNARSVVVRTAPREPIVSCIAAAVSSSGASKMATPVRCRFVQRPGAPPTVIQRAAEVGGVASATGVGDLSNGLDLCDSLRLEHQRRGIVWCGSHQAKGEALPRLRIRMRDPRPASVVLTEEGRG